MKYVNISLTKNLDFELRTGFEKKVNLMLYDSDEQRSLVPIP